MFQMFRKCFATSQSQMFPNELNVPKFMIPCIHATANGKWVGYSRGNSQARSAARACFGMAANALLFGANTVKVPSPESVSTKSAALTAVKRVDKSSTEVTRPASVGNVDAVNQAHRL